MAKAKTQKKSHKNNKAANKISNVLIVYRPSAADAQKMAAEVARWLKNKQIESYSHPEQKIPGVKKISQDQLKNLHLVVALGGDGTYLESVHVTSGHHVPILGVNLGTLGFLANTRKEDVFQVLSLALNGKLEERPRSMLHVKVIRGGKVIGKHDCLNDVVLERGSVSQLINIAIYSEDNLVGEVKADGLVVSSPTGSTAYNLSAGGPILHPQVSAVVVTPICPHSLTHRPIVFPDDQKLTFRLLNKKHKSFVTIDGRTHEELRPNDEVVVTKSSQNHVVLRKSNQSYFDLLRTKLKFGIRN